MDFRITGLPLADFAALLQLDDDALRARGVQRVVADAPNAYPCRITLEDAAPGEELLLLSYAHLPARMPYASAGPIFIRRSAAATRTVINAVPEQQRRRLLSVRAYDPHDCMVDADVIEGTELEPLIRRFLATPEVSYLHVHNARRGCYACRVDRNPSRPSTTAPYPRPPVTPRHDPSPQTSPASSIRSQHTEQSST